MRSCAGCGKDVGRYYLPRSTIPPPSTLLEQVWPNIESSRRALMADPNNQKYVTAHRFMNAMDYLRVVLLQDAAYFMTQCPERACHAVYGDAIFQSTEFARYKQEFATQYTHKTLPQNDPTLKHVQLVAPRIGTAMENLATSANEQVGKITTIGKAIELEGEAAYRQRRQIYEEMLTHFRRQEAEYLVPIRREVEYVANFIRGGVEAARSNVAEPRFLFQPTAAGNFGGTETPQQPSRPFPAYEARTPVIDQAFPCTNTAASEVTPSPTQNATNPRMMPPHSDAFESAVHMYFGWIGLVDDDGTCNKGIAYENLFEDTEWRKAYCRKNTAEMKRMQRMRTICNLLRKHAVFADTTALAIGDGINCLLDKAFVGNIPAIFSWTRYEMALKTYDKQVVN